MFLKCYSKPAPALLSLYAEGPCIIFQSPGFTILTERATYLDLAIYKEAKQRCSNQITQQVVMTYRPLNNSDHDWIVCCKDTPFFLFVSLLPTWSQPNDL